MGRYQRRNNNKLVFCAFFLALLLYGCDLSSEPEPIQFGKDQCQHCKMTIVDRRFGGEFISSKGKIYTFDSLDCLVKFYSQTGDAQAQVYLVSYDRPGSLMRSDSAAFIYYDTVDSPMGSKYIALSSSAQARRMLADPNAPILSWQELLQKYAP